MELEKLGDEKIIHKNYGFLLKAKENGFFQDMEEGEDITVCQDWIVVHWIDELGNYKREKGMVYFVDEILPCFRRWYDNGIKSNGVGIYFQILKYAERCGLKINKDSFECLMLLTQKNILDLESEEKGFSYVSKHFLTKRIISTLIRFQKKNIPIDYIVGENYDIFCELDAEDNLDYGTYIFFRTASLLTPEEKKSFYNSRGLKNEKVENLYWDNNDSRRLYSKKKLFENLYDSFNGYVTFNAQEILRLFNWLKVDVDANGSNDRGYNKEYVTMLRELIRKNEKIIEKRQNIEKLTKLNDYIGKKVSVSYYELDENGNGNLKNIKGEVVSTSENQIKLKDNSDNEVTIEDNDTSIINSVSYDFRIIFNNRIYEQRKTIAKLEIKIKNFTADNVLERYVKKFGSIEGLGYIKTSGNLFVELVDKEIYPIDNLFALCFETMAELFPKEKILGYSLHAYQKIMMGEYPFLSKYTFSFPMNKFIGPNEEEVIRRICFQVAHAKSSEVFSSDGEEISASEKKVLETSSLNDNTGKVCKK